MVKVFEARPKFQEGKGGWQDGQLLSPKGDVLSTMPERSGLKVINGKVKVTGVSSGESTIPVYQESGRTIDTERRYFAFVGVDNNIVRVEGHNTPDVVAKIQKLLDS